MSAAPAPPAHPSPQQTQAGGRFQLILGLVIGAGALILALWGVPLADVGAALAGAELVWLVPLAALFMLQQALRAWRQLVLLRAHHPHVGFRSSFGILCVSFLAINTLPARLGEVVRPLLLLERERVPLGTGFAIVFLERVIDLCAALTMLALAAWLVPAPSQVVEVAGVELDWVGLGRSVSRTALPVLLGGVLGVLLFGRQLVARLGPVAERAPGPLRTLLGIGLRFAETFVAGLEAVRSPRRLAAVLGLTVVTWVETILMFVVLAHAFGLQRFIGFGEGMGVLAIVMLGAAVPAPPGMAGTYEAFCRAGLAVYGASGSAAPPDGAAPSLDAAAIAYALVMHWFIYLVQASSAIWFLVVDRIDLRRLARLARSGQWKEALDPEAAPPG
ncbi:MAG: flippase-like domain-containing protein [Alphaproteobacteria bacterium]|nr:flippase-like domain-containing protein [Alphaproteobacteria bacterium]